ncbi:PREDICTED: von Willebrand factor A domain-containing protein 2-like [Branchiostoma belcheri]|uniref:von Willebrand factor A domain-containing protein 2-like n=1 Tax=Branchiostoma belcheri TaxID=7741 RepID=A0A6P4YE76_BRABE|nr:PREDICTED: von Willebrand factor A domain-containing protein 2-like [Branchiostoma belcheri]
MLGQICSAKLDLMLVLDGSGSGQICSAKLDLMLVLDGSGSGQICSAKLDLMLVLDGSGSGQICNANLDLMLVIDGSGSVGDVDFAKVLQFAEKLVNAFDIGPDLTRVGVVQYSDYSTLEFNLGAHGDKASTIAAVNNIVYQGGGTATGEALEYTRVNAAWRAAPVPKVMIVVTDGKSADSVMAPANALASSGVDVYAIGVGNYDAAELMAIAAQDQGKVIELADFNALNAEIEHAQFAQTVCVVAQQPKPCASNPCQNNSNCVSINGGDAYECRCFPGWLGANCETLDYCRNQQCESGGTCMNQPTGFVCSCPPGWEGTHCETPSCQNTVSLCGNSPGWPDIMFCSVSHVLAACPEFCGTCTCPTNPECKNGGSRGNDPNLWGEDTCKCACVGSWTGPTCEVCSVHCDVFVGSVDPTTCTCQCFDGWGGPTCTDFVGH